MDVDLKDAHPFPRKPRLDAELLEALASHVSKGNFRYVSAQAEGIPPNTFKEWVRLGNHEIADIESGKLNPSRMTLYGMLVIKLGIAESKFHMGVVSDLTAPDVDLKIKWDFLKKRYGKTYSNMPGSMDDETGEEAKIDPLALVAERLKELMDR